jgi:hypothetical protein
MRDIPIEQFSFDVDEPRRAFRDYAHSIANRACELFRGLEESTEKLWRIQTQLAQDEQLIKRTGQNIGRIVMEQASMVQKLERVVKNTRMNIRSIVRKSDQTLQSMRFRVGSEMFDQLNEDNRLLQSEGDHDDAEEIVWNLARRQENAEILLQSTVPYDEYIANILREQQDLIKKLERTQDNSRINIRLCTRNLEGHITIVERRIMERRINLPDTFASPFMFLLFGGLPQILDQVGQEIIILEPLKQLKVEYSNLQEEIENDGEQKLVRDITRRLEETEGLLRDKIELLERGVHLLSTNIVVKSDYERVVAEIEKNKPLFESVQDLSKIMSFLNNGTALMDEFLSLPISKKGHCK